MKTLAIIPAGGAGTRMGQEVPKQYLSLAGIPVIVHTLQALQRSPVIDEMYLAVPEGDVGKVGREVVDRYGLSKVTRVLAGGRERIDSVRNALIHCRDDHDIVLVHDGVRPFVSGDVIRRVVDAAAEHGAATCGIPVQDTLKEVTAAGWVITTVSRAGLWLTQTPQAFRREILQAAYEKAREDAFFGTDDSSLVERMGVPVRMVPGGGENFKLTTPEDLARGELICRSVPSTAIS